MFFSADLEEKGGSMHRVYVSREFEMKNITCFNCTTSFSYFQFKTFNFTLVESVFVNVDTHDDYSSDQEEFPTIFKVFITKMSLEATNEFADSDSAVILIKNSTF